MGRADPWTEQLAPLFNDIAFKPPKVCTVAGGVCWSDIAELDPTNRPHERDAGYLSSKWNDLKAQISIVNARFTNTGQGDPDKFREFSQGRTYIMYAFCFFQHHPLLESLASKEVEIDAQRETGVGRTLRGRESEERPSKRRIMKNQVEILGLEEFVSAFSGQSQASGFDKDLAQAEKERVGLEVEAARSKATSARHKSLEDTYEAIKSTKFMQQDATCLEEKELFANILRSLYSDLKDRMTDDTP